jgi:hypothetical protein
MSPFPRWRKTVRKWWRWVAALVGFYAGWAWGRRETLRRAELKRSTEESRKAYEVTRRAMLEYLAELGPQWWARSHAMEEEGLVPPPV